ncbi:MAG: hypothetical protein EA407_02205 [Rhodobacteraceae bacterium]|nr:MAG: hypothetical protein EA407_02205 [Paracoccaceae bacterium]
MRVVILLLALTGVPVCADEIGPEALSNLPPAQIVFLGEVHDNPLHHEYQAKAIAAIEPRALVFEMLTSEQAGRVPEPLPDEAALGDLLEWSASGWPGFAMYYPLFTAAPKASIFGAALPRDQARAAMGQPLDEVFEGDPARFGLEEALDPEVQATREARQNAAHCDALPAEMLPAFVDIQRLRDAMLADAALRAHEATGGPVVVITGTGHTRTDWGAPAKLARAAPELSSLSIGQYEAPLNGPAPNDLWLVTEPHPRPDPCEAFR